MNLSDIHEDIGHTFIHYLYTGTYETAKPTYSNSNPAGVPADLSPRAREFRLSMHAYHASRRYGLAGLTDLSKTYIRVFDIDVSTLYILNIAREISSTLPSDEIWFWEYIREKLAIAFEDDEPGLRSDIAAYGVGRDPFDAFLVTVVLDIYASALPGRVLGVNGHGAHSEVDRSASASVSEHDIFEEDDEEEEEVNEWDSEPEEHEREFAVDEEEQLPHAIEKPLALPEPEPEPEPEVPADTYTVADEVPELETARSPPQVPISPSPPLASPTPLPEEDYDRWAHYGTYMGPATGVPARLTTLIEEQAEHVPEDNYNPATTESEEWTGFHTISKKVKKKKRGRHYDLAPPRPEEHEPEPADPIDPVAQEPPQSIDPEPEPEPGIPLPEPAVPQEVGPPADAPKASGYGEWSGLQGQEFGFYSPGPVAIAE